VGNNNCGKTTIFKAIEFIQSGKNKLDFITQGLETENISVELEFKGADLSEEEYRKLFKGSAVKRAKYKGLMRNIEAAACFSREKQLPLSNKSKDYEQENK
ncbi:MAG: hypothetical protein ACFNNK_08510, partial [Segatella oris]